MCIYIYVYVCVYILYNQHFALGESHAFEQTCSCIVYVNADMPNGFGGLKFENLPICLHMYRLTEDMTL